LLKLASKSADGQRPRLRCQKTSGILGPSQSRNDFKLEGGKVIMRVFIAVVLFVVAGAAPALGQAINPEFVHGRDYTFERMEARRAVRDAQDTSTIRLVAYVYRPIKNDRREVVLFSHGSTAGLARSPKEPLDVPPPAVIRFFVSRGYTLIAPMRRGRGESTGTYVEECSVYIGQCTVADQLALTDRSLREALLDTDAVIEQLILGQLVSRESKILAGGISRGGFLSLILAGERPRLVKGVINFVGGWHGVTDRLTETENKQRMDAQTVRLARAAKQTRAPSIWFYAARDPFYKEGVPRELLRSWQDAGGQAEYIFINDHSLPSGHIVASNVALWERQVDAFLKTIEEVKR
jgi:pimeloyl-ACP methyl ester carboxylesterase